MRVSVSKSLTTRGNKSLFSLGTAPQTLRAAPLVGQYLHQGPRARGGRDPLLCRRGEQQGRSGAAAHRHPRAGCFGRARPVAEQASAVDDTLMSSEPTCARPCTHTAKPTPQNPLRRLPSRLLRRHILPRPSALAIPVPHLRLPRVQATSTLTVYHTPSSSDSTSMRWHSRRSTMLHLWLRTCPRRRVWHAMGRVYPPPQICGMSRTRRSPPPVLPPRSPTRCMPLPGKTGL
jgi:hypothetical protein